MTGLIEPGHMFSQHSLSTFCQCPRRFRLKYIDRQPWPMVDADQPLEYERFLERGRIFHQWVARDLLGAGGRAIIDDADDPDLAAWWRAYQAFDMGDLPAAIREVELPVVVPLGDYRLYARYDLLALDPDGDAVIVDWKTLQARPRPQVLRERMQTRVYLFTAVAAGSVLTGGRPILPERASMLYWFANFSETFEVRYSELQYRQDRDEITELATRIASLPADEFPMAEDQRLCAYCNYRTLCHSHALTSEGDRDAWLDEDLDVAIDLATVPEIDF